MEREYDTARDLELLRSELRGLRSEVEMDRNSRFARTTSARRRKPVGGG